MAEKAAVKRSAKEGDPFASALDHLYRFAGIVGSNLDVDTLLDDTVQPLLTMSGANQLFIALFSRGEGIKAIVKQAEWPDITSASFEAELGDRLGQEASTYASARELPDPIAKLIAHPTGFFVLLPLCAYGRSLGFAALQRADSPFDAPVIKLLNTAGRQLALAIENSRLFEDLQQSYRKLIGAQEELIRQERLAALGGLAATMAHEIRNPLATIFSSLSQIRKHAKIEGDSATLLGIAEEEALRLNRMVAGLLEFARPRTPRLEEVRPLDIAVEVIARAESSADFPNGIEISVKENACAEAFLFDPELLRRALDHLVANALAAVALPQGKISINIEKNPDVGHSVLIAISDNGAGIAPEILNDIFEPFFSTKPSGIGLGLPVVKRIVEDHAGTVEINSSPGKGTEVRLLFAANKNGNAEKAMGVGDE